MKKIFCFLAIIVTIAAVAFAVPLLPTIQPAGTVHHGYGGFSLSSTTITIGSGSTWYPIKNATDNLWTLTEGTGVTIATDNLIFEHKGDYVGQLSIYSCLYGEQYGEYKETGCPESVGYYEG